MNEETVDFDIPLRSSYVTFQLPDNREGNGRITESRANHQHSVENDDEFDHLESLTSSPGEKMVQLERRRTVRREVAKYCRGISETSFLGEQLSLRRVKTEHHDVKKYIARAGGVDNALLKVLTEKDSIRFTEAHITTYVVEFLSTGADVNITNEDGDTPLHLAARKPFRACSTELLKWGSNANKENSNSQTALEIALSMGLDEDDQGRVQAYSLFSAKIIEEMRPAKVRNIFVANPIRPCKISFHKMLKNPDMEEAVKAVLDSLVEPLQGSTKHVKVFYSVLEANKDGHTPDKISQWKAKSALEQIILQGNKEMVTHLAVRLLMQSKWKHFARSTFIVHAVFFVVLFAIMTFAFILGVDAANSQPKAYSVNDPVSIIRGVLEGITLLMITSAFFSELYNIAMWRHQYIIDHLFFYFNYLTIIAAVSIYIMILLRVLDSRAQWALASVAYVFYGFKAFKYMLGIRIIGNYVYILLLMIQRDVFLFLVVFIEFLFAFSGGLYFALNSEAIQVEATVVTENGTNGTDVNMTTTINVPESQFNDETGSYFAVFFTGIRILVEGGSVIDNYYGGEAGLAPFGVFTYLAFIFLVVVVLLSLLIAQMSDTFANIQADADRAAVLIRGTTIVSTERAGFPFINFRKVFFKKEEIWKNPKKHVGDVSVPKIDIVTTKVGKLEKLHEAHGEILQELRANMADQRRNTAQQFEQLLSELQKITNSSKDNTGNRDGTLQ